MRRLVQNKKVVIGAIVLLFVFGLNLVSSGVRGFAVAVSAPVSSVLWNAGNSIALFFGGGELRQEYELLTQENLELRQKLVLLEETVRENEELRRIFDLDIQEELQVATGEIIARKIASDTIIIRGGEDKGLQKGMPVITAQKVAVGRVEEVFDNYATVVLLSANDRKLDAKTGTITGIITGKGAHGLSFGLVPQEESLQHGDVVVTSSLGNVFPENMLVGEITDVVKTGSDPFQHAAVQFFFDARATEFVFVVLSDV